MSTFQIRWTGNDKEDDVIITLSGREMISGSELLFHFFALSSDADVAEFTIPNSLNLTLNSVQCCVEYLELFKDQESFSIPKPLSVNPQLTQFNAPLWALQFIDKHIFPENKPPQWDLCFNLLKTSDYLVIHSLTELVGATIACRLRHFDKQELLFLTENSTQLMRDDLINAIQDNPWVIEDELFSNEIQRMVDL